MTQKIKLIIVIFICFLVIILLIVYTNSNLFYTNLTTKYLPNKKEKIFLTQDIVHQQKYYANKLSVPCVDIKNIDGLIHVFENYKSVFNDIQKIECQEISVIFDLIFDIDLSNGSEIIIPVLMEKLVQDTWLKGDEELFRKFKKPKTVTLTNRWTFETTGINPLRAIRPRPNVNFDDPLKYTLDVIRKSKVGCQFCDKNFTIIDRFGRIELSKSNLYSAHNAFQYTDNVGIFIPGAIHNWMEVKYYNFCSLV